MSAVLWLSVFACVLSSVQFSSVQLCSALCHPMDCSTSGLPVHHRLPELAQTHVHQVGGAIQPSLLLPPVPPSIRVFSNESVLHSRGPSTEQVVCSVVSQYL